MTADTIELLHPSDVLAGRELVSAPGRSADDRDVRVIGDAVRCGRPVIYPVPGPDLPPALQRRAGAGYRYVGAIFAFDLGDLGDGERYQAVRFEVELADRRAVALRLDGDGGALGLTFDNAGPAPASTAAAHTVTATRARPDWLRRLLNRRGVPRAWTLGLQNHRFRWTYEDPRSALLLPRSYAVHALIEVPADLAEIHGTIDMHVDVSTRASTVLHADLRDSIAFSESVPALTGPADVTGSAAVRLCMAADVSGYSSRTNAETERIQGLLVDILARARRAAGIADSAVAPQAHGDGQFTVLPPGIDESAVIPRLIDELGTALREVNAVATPDARLRLRLALHRGLVKPACNGWVGSSTIAVHRLLDSPPLRTALREHAAADFVLGIPDVLFQDVIVHAAEPPLPSDFTPVVVDLPEKSFVEHCWVAVGTTSSVRA
ncbi:hypothetical protein EAD96_23945 [Micromonospora sp. BL1]|uniref:hypothetical protein n=1 Tax=Micromonospora sp. BL1 TaxID=2478709 RepID=UPI000EF60E33|nr:hypothetical protein [Micromonospora sp. BL1]RLQ01399.1 hypothetical protein EAD96_23945 [Micromonospora sp. BL1]